MENLIEVSPQIKTKGFHKCLGSLEIRKTGISFIIGYHTLNQLKEMPYCPHPLKSDTA